MRPLWGVANVGDTFVWIAVLWEIFRIYALSKDCISVDIQQGYHPASGLVTGDKLP